jgi:hypothetical protein
MNELKQKYYTIRQQAFAYMQTGNVNAYLSKLIALNDVQMQMIQIATAPR